MSWKRPAIFQSQDFLVLFLTRIFVSLSLLAQAVIVGWQIYKIRPDPLLLGLMGFIEAVPAISCSFVSGHLVDIHRPAKIYQLSLLVLFLNACMIFYAGANSGLPADLRLVLLFAGIFISGAARSFTSPSVFSLIPQVVPRNMLPASSAWNSSAYQFAAIVGPSLGGLVYGFCGVAQAFLMPPFFMLMALVVLFFLSAQTKELKSKTKREPFIQSIQAGIRFAFVNKVLLSTMALDMFSVLFGGAVAILPLFADQVLHVGSTGLGLLRSAPAAGSALVLLYLAFKPLKFISGRMFLIVVAGFGLATVLFALSKTLMWAMIFLAVSGAFDGISMVIRGTILQLLTPDHMRGRVSSLSSIFITSSNEMGAFESGLAAKLFGTVPSVVFGGGMTLLIVAMTAYFTPELARTKINTDEEPTSVKT